MKFCPTCNNKYEDKITFCPRDGEVLEHEKTTLVGSTLDNQYMVEALLGQGGMGTVYRARHILLGDSVAIKVLPTHLSNDPETLRRFLREGQIARRFRHPNVVTVHDLRAADGMAYMVLEYIEGRTLKGEMKEHGPFSAQEALQVLEPVANALNAAHAMSIVHRDLKLDNIMIHRPEDGPPVIKLLDLGIAKINEAGATAMTRTGQILGTPGYMPPEQWGAATTGDDEPKIDGRADIYCLGVAFFELISGRLPYEGTTVQEMAAGHVMKPVPLIHKIVKSVPEAFSFAIARAMAKKRNERFATCDEFIAALHSALRNAEIGELPTQVGSAVEVRVGAEVETTLLLYDFQTAALNNTGEMTDRHNGQAQYFTEELSGGVTMDMVWIPDGTFLMGSPETELKRSKEEGPRHQVTLGSFFMSKYPVTQAQWRAVAALPQVRMTLDPDPASFKGELLPVESVSWEDCQEFCARISYKTGRTYYLPSEAQWEYACRAGTLTPFHFGETITTELANYNGLFRYGQGPRGENRNATVSAGSLGYANAFGLYDMHGNVWEWCNDNWHDNYDNAPTDGRGWEQDGDPARRVIRGGCWNAGSMLCRSATRAGSGPQSRSDTIGFRVITFFASPGNSSSNTSRLTLHWINRNNMDTIS